jgi:hypothetical protein
MTNHTTGPWTENACEVQAPDGSPICEMLARPEDADKWGRHHADANSRLICASPDLLAALETLLLSAERDDMNARVRAMAAAREAIAKAGGVK